jgi:Uma2 family endonuclease
MSDTFLESAAQTALDPHNIRCERNGKRQLRLDAPPSETIWLMIMRFERGLRRWVHENKRTGEVVVRRRIFLGNGWVLSPDIAFLAPSKEGAPFFVDRCWPLKLCPKFVVEFCSNAHELQSFQRKMLFWIASGAELGWLVAPHAECMFVYAPGVEPLIVGEFGLGQGRLHGFVLPLAELWCLKEC